MQTDRGSGWWCMLHGEMQQHTSFRELEERTSSLRNNVDSHVPLIFVDVMFKQIWTYVVTSF
jgi:hypothetical protein